MSGLVLREEPERGVWIQEILPGSPAEQAGLQAEDVVIKVSGHDATELGIVNGDRVRVTSRRGQVELKAVIDGRGTPARGSVFVPFFDENILINVVTLDAMDNISKQPDYKKCAVRLVKA